MDGHEQVFVNNLSKKIAYLRFNLIDILNISDVSKKGDGLRCDFKETRPHAQFNNIKEVIQCSPLKILLDEIYCVSLISVIVFGGCLSLK